ncbi:protein containing Biotin protein ligase, partial [human gut metagenome]
ELDHNEIAVDIVNNLDRYIIRRDALNSENTGEIINRLKMYSASLGQIVRVITPDSEYDAKVLDIAPDGGLVILSDGETKTITSGEIVHIR